MDTTSLAGKNKIAIHRTNSAYPDFRDLIIELDKDLAKRNGALDSEYRQHNKIEHIDTVLVAYLENKPVGCVCFKPLSDDTVEIKRMFVPIEERGKGIAKLLLAQLEHWAAELNFTTAKLETGFTNPEAIALYQKAGYTTIPNYGPYVDMENSICMSKKLAL